MKTLLNILQYFSTPFFHSRLAAFILLSLFFFPTLSSAYCVYNYSGQTIDVRTVNDGSTLRNHELKPYGGNAFEDDGDEDYACANYADHLGLPRGKIITVWTTHANWGSIVSMQAGGWANIYQRSRNELSPFAFGAYVPDYYTVSYDHTTSNVRSDSRPAGYIGNSLSPADRNVRFVVSADPQYITGHSDEIAQNNWNNSADAVAASMVHILNTTNARGVLLAGDLTQSGKTDELKMYTDSTAGVRRFFFDGIGNHHPNDADNLDLSTIQRNTVLTLRSGPHYSWDWQDIHFVQLNIYPGNSSDTGQYGGLDPRDSLNFLNVDLITSVGNTGRPVVLIHHYGFDGFSTGSDDWWTATQRAAYLSVLSNYNVVAMFTGHSHPSKINSMPSVTIPVGSCGVGTNNGVTGSCWDFIAGAGRGSQAGAGQGEGVFMDVEINHCNQMIVTRKDKTGTEIPGQAFTIDFTAPGPVNDVCNTEPIADAGGPYTGSEGQSVTFDASGSNDPDGDGLEYRWQFDGATWTTWSSSPSSTYTWNDDFNGNVTLEVRDDGNPQKSHTTIASITVDNVSPTIDWVSTTSIKEGETGTVKGTFSDPALGQVTETFTGSVLWDDGVSTALTIGFGTFSTSRVFADDHPSSGTQADLIRGSITIKDDDLGSDSRSATMLVANVSPTINSISVNSSSINESQTATVTGTFSDPAQGQTTETFTGSALWSDGVSTAVIVGTGTYTTSRVFADDYPSSGTASDSFSVNITIKDDDLGSDSKTSPSVTVNNVNPVAVVHSISDQLSGQSIAYVLDSTTPVPGFLNVVLVGTAINFTGSYTDIGSPDTHDSPLPKINWGDGSSDNVAISVSGSNSSGAYGTTNASSHTYSTALEPGAYTIVFEVADDDTGVGSISAAINVVGVTGGLDNTLEKIQDIIETAAALPEAEQFLQETIISLTGYPGDDDGDDKSGALDMLERDNLNPAMVKIGHAIELLIAAEQADPGLDLTVIKNQLSLTARLILIDALNRAKAVAQKNNERRNIQRAMALLDAGDIELANQDFAMAIEEYIDAVRSIHSLI